MRSVLAVPALVFFAVAIPGLSAVAIAAPQETATRALEDLTPVPVRDGIAELSPENTKVEFVGTHVGDDPRPRLGGFREIAGKIEVNAAGQEIRSIEAEVDVTSVWTEFNNLTNHLKTPDFLEVEKFPKATFTSTKIEQADDGTVNITGDMTIHGTTRDVTLPATVEFRDGGITLRAELTIDRTQFGMEKMQEGVEPEVSLTIVVGAKTEPRPAR